MAVKDPKRGNTSLIVLMLAGLTLLGVLVAGVGCIGLFFCDANGGMAEKYPYSDSLTTLPLGEANDMLPSGIK